MYSCFNISAGVCTKRYVSIEVAQIDTAEETKNLYISFTKITTLEILDTDGM
jgi:hypothetical protein